MSAGMFEPQAGLAFPVSLAEKYRPQHVGDFIGLEKPKKVVSAFVRAPREAAFLFVGPPGVGKTTLALAMAADMGIVEPFDLHLISSQKCTVDVLESVIRQCQYCTHKPDGFHVVICDEADRMSPAAQLALLSKLDSTARPPRTIFIFTCNETGGLEKRFLSRCMVLEFSSYGLRGELAAFLADVWSKETQAAPTVDFDRVAKDATNNVRDCLMRIEVELLAVA